MFKRSTPALSGAAIRAARAAVLTVSGALVLSSCSLLEPLVGGAEQPSKPVWVESREEALARADQVQNHVRELTGLERDPWTKLTAY
ncbi:hypothetical protein ACGF13_10320 [Kitasatospora sp. NPDC048286]|uniref:hypothetical protein n=1 Tax=Kitasatospora sp. NPDC048286 TaxID=3364047 RepID=UPI00371E7993